MAAEDLLDGGLGGCRVAGHKDDPVPQDGQLLGSGSTQTPTAPGTIPR